MSFTEERTGERVTLAPNATVRVAHRQRSLEEGWTLVRVAPGTARTPAELTADAGAWSSAKVPGTVCSALGGEDAAKLDQWDFWYRARFDASPERGVRSLLVFEGLATLTTVWLNGKEILTSDSMFQAHAVDVTGVLQPSGNELFLHFRALLPVLRARHPRGRFPTRLVSEKNLRCVRTSLLGYQPGFCDHVRIVGPYRPVRLVEQRLLSVERADVRPRLEGARGVLEVVLTCARLEGSGRVAASLVLGKGRARSPMEEIRGEGRQLELRGRLELEDVEPWWPHTHGRPALYELAVEVEMEGSALTIELGPIGFRKIELASREELGFTVNGVALFCRGASWTPLDVASLQGDEPTYRRALEQVRDAGMNMLRLPGNMAYESDLFFQLADELGILVWQDFMFARMDYPTEPAFFASVRMEAEQVLARLHARPSLAILCGNTEVAQQAAMLGLPEEASASPIFDQLLPELCARAVPGVPYVSSSPSGGVLPFHTSSGPTHYFGVGAYLRPLEDARLSKVRFASECLAFSNVPDESTLAAWLGEELALAHHARYKERVPRDAGAGWDFADVTDHYLESLFGVDARRLRYADHERYLALCRVTTGEVMARVQGMWRARGSTCRGALIWLLRDIWDGAGWGVIDARGVPKSTYHALKRAWAPVALWIVDDGLEGLTVHAANDGVDPLEVTLELELYREDGGVVERAVRRLTLAPQSVEALAVEALIGRFVDSSYAYRFGPPGHTLVAARLRRAVGVEPALAQAFHLPLGLTREVRSDVGLEAAATWIAGESGQGEYELTVRSARFAQAVAIHAPGYIASDNYFHLAPAVPWTVRLRGMQSTSKAGLRAKVRASNAAQAVVLRVEPPVEQARERG